MKPVNLLPVSRLDALRQRIRVRAWSGIIGGFSALLGATYFAAQFAWYYDRPALEQAVEAAELQNTDASDKSFEMRSKVRAASEQLHATRAIGNLPDWSILLAAIENATEEHIVLNKLSVSTTSKSLPSTEPDVKPKEIVTTAVRLSGIGTDASHVSEFSLRLEATNLFLEVEIIGGKRRAEDGQNEFTMSCKLLEEIR